MARLLLLLLLGSCATVRPSGWSLFLARHEVDDEFSVAGEGPHDRAISHSVGNGLLYGVALHLGRPDTRSPHEDLLREEISELRGEIADQHRSPQVQADEYGDDQDDAPAPAGEVFGVEHDEAPFWEDFTSVQTLLAMILGALGLYSTQKGAKRFKKKE